MHPYEIALIAGVAVPLLMFAVLALFGYRIGKPAAGWCAVAAVMASLALSIYVLVGWLGGTAADHFRLGQEAARYTWLTMSIGANHIPVQFGVKLDSLTVVMYFMVTLVSTCIFVFSVGYMSGHSDEVDGISKYHRFFAYLCLFEFSMLGLVISASLFFLFVFWELVGLCSYLLIGFYFDRKYASDAGIKAFVTNRVGDFGFLIGLMLVFTFLQTLDLDQAARTFAEQAHMKTGIFAPVVQIFGWHITGVTLATVMGIGLFCGAIGKSAQFPLHVWLPDAMAGPTPVSALIHAATMVAAGVYLVARIFRLLTPEAQMFVAVIGCITLTITALIAIVQTDIKKVLAYSTLSQLGYMIFGLGVGAWIAALFHLIVHAFFKAMLFLCSGQVIEGCHHEQDIRRMGGLHKKMPVTCWTFFVGVLAIAGFGIPALNFGLGGYFSKDEILAVAYERAYNWTYRFEEGAEHGAAGHHADAAQPQAKYMLAQHHAAEPDEDKILEEDAGYPGEGEIIGSEAAREARAAKQKIGRDTPVLPKWMFWLPIIIAYVTPFYMMRCWWLTFMGKPRDEEVHHHAHEMPLMWVPLVVLSIGTVFTSYFLFRPEIAEAGRQATNAAMVVAVDGGEHGELNMLSLTHEAAHNPHGALIYYVGFAWLIGMVFAWLIYRKGFILAERLRRIWPLNWAYVALEQKLFFDHVYNTVFVAGTQWVVAQAARLVDTYIIDGLANLLARITVGLANFSGWVLDAAGIDGIVNGLGETAEGLGDIVRRPQTGRIRNYLLFGTAGASLVLIAIVIVAVKIG